MTVKVTSQNYGGAAQSDLLTSWWGMLQPFEAFAFFKENLQPHYSSTNPIISLGDDAN